MNEEIILSKLYEYLKKHNIKYKKIGRTSATLECIFCKTGTMQVLPNTYKLNCFACKPKEKLGHYYTLIDIARKVDNLDTEVNSDEDVLQHIKEELKIDVMTKKDEQDIDKVLDFYEKNGFDLVPIIANGKRPIEAGWTNKTHKDKHEWKNWIVNGVNLGAKCGVCSNLLIIDIDQKPIPEEIKKLMGTTLMQESTKGFHLFYKYDKDFPKTRIDDFKIDIETTGGQVVIYPSKVKDIERKIILNPIIEIPKELKKLLLDKITVPRQTDSEKIKQDIQTEDFKIDANKFALKNNNLDGCCNAEFIKLGGILRKQLNIQNTSYVLHVLNKHLLAYPMQSKAITSMVNELSHYSQFDEQELAHRILEHLKDVDEANRTEISNTIVGTNRGEDKKRVDKSLKYLVTNEYVVKRGTKYEIIKAMNWSGKLLNIGIPVKFKVPYFHEWAYLNQDDVIIVGSQNKYGKTTLSMNFVKKLVNQGIKPDYIYNESGGRFAKVALKLGMKDDDFDSAFCADPDKVILRKNKVTIFDWVKPKDFARSVDKDTPVLIKNWHGITEFIPINDLSLHHDFRNTQIYTQKGWTKLQRVIKHKCDRKMYRIITKTSIIECTEDHSLIINNKKVSPKELKIGDRVEIIEPKLINKRDIGLEWAWFHGLISAEGCLPRYYKYKDRTFKRVSNFSLVNNNKQLLIRASKTLSKFGFDTDIKLYKSNKKCYVLRLKGQSEKFQEQLSQWHINKDSTKKVPYFILSSSLEAKKAYLDGYIAGDGNICSDNTFRFGTIDKTLFTGLCYILKCLKYNFTVGFTLAKSKNQHNCYNAKTNLGLKCVLKRPSNMIKDIQIYDSKDYIYDLQTKDHTFNGGCGDLINLHNTDNLFSDLVEKTKKSHGFLICFVQLRKDDTFFAKDQIAQFPSLVTKYTHNNAEGTDTQFEITDIRDAKIHGKKFVIPCIYDWTTHEVKTVYEIEQEEKR